MKNEKPNCSICDGSNILNKEIKKHRYFCKDCNKTFTSRDDDPDVDTTTDTETIQYEEKKTLSAWCPVSGLMMDIDNYCKAYNLPRKDIKSYKLVTHTGTPFYNIAFHEHEEDSEFLTDEFINSIVKKHIKPVEFKRPLHVSDDDTTRVVYSDAHIGMSPDKEGIALYGGTWSHEDQQGRMVEITGELVGDSSGLLIVDELGDMADGWDAKTVRKGHDLPQNMSNEEMFDQCVNLKVCLADNIVSLSQYNEIVFNNICNDNHAGAFGYVINSAVKQILEIKYPGLVKVVNHRKFINHYLVGEHTFIISHGKDKENLRFGFKPHLDPRGEKKIVNYIIDNDLKGFIEFSKGDSHQLLLDYATSDLFDYFNFGSFAPPSQWVQVNFQKGRSSFVIEKFNKNKRKKNITPIFF